MHVDYPYHFDHRGHTATTTDDDHVRDLIEQFLFTAPGERVNRPDFGSGLQQLVFDPNSVELAETVQFTIRAGLDRWLGDLIEVRDLEVTSHEASLRVVLRYAVRRSGESRSVVFERSGS